MGNCPYCGERIHINHDDGYGYDECEIFEQECGHCGKVFVYTTQIVFYHDLKQAPCKNGGEHNLRKIKKLPFELYEYQRECIECGEVVVIDQEAHNNNLKKLYGDEDD